MSIAPDHESGDNDSDSDSDVDLAFSKKRPIVGAATKAPNVRPKNGPWYQQSPWIDNPAIDGYIFEQLKQANFSPSVLDDMEVIGMCQQYRLYKQDKSSPVPAYKPARIIPSKVVPDSIMQAVKDEIGEELCDAIRLRLGNEGFVIRKFWEDCEKHMSNIYENEPPGKRIVTSQGPAIVPITFQGTRYYIPRQPLYIFHWIDGNLIPKNASDDLTAAIQLFAVREILDHRSELEMPSDSEPETEPERETTSDLETETETEPEEEKKVEPPPKPPRRLVSGGASSSSAAAALARLVSDDRPRRQASRHLYGKGAFYVPPKPVEFNRSSQSDSSSDTDHDDHQKPDRYGRVAGDVIYEIDAKTETLAKRTSQDRVEGLDLQSVLKWYRTVNSKVFKGNLPPASGVPNLYDVENKIAIVWSDLVRKPSGYIQSSVTDDGRRVPQRLLLNARKVTTVSAMQSVVAHEMCHIADEIIERASPDEDSHGEGFKKWAAVVNRIYPHVHVQTFCDGCYRFMWECQNCHECTSTPSNISPTTCAFCHTQSEFNLIEDRGERIDGRQPDLYTYTCAECRTTVNFYDRLTLKKGFAKDVVCQNPECEAHKANRHSMQLTKVFLGKDPEPLQKK